MIQSACGLLVLAAIAWLVSENRRKASLRSVAAALALQLLLAALLYRLPASQYVFRLLNRGVEALEAATRAGTGFVFGYVGGGPLPFALAHPGADFVLAFQALPLVLVISALSALLFHWRILPAIVRGFAWALRRTLGIGGALGVMVASNIFLGMIESPLLIRPYLAQLTRSELFTMMTCGMSMIAGTVMVVYATILKGAVPDPIGQLLTASIVSAPSSVLIARLMVPETGESTAGELTPPGRYRSSMDAIAQGTMDGVQLLIAILAMLIVLVALVALVNHALALLPAWGGTAVTLQRLLGFVMAPVAWLMGVPWAEAGTAGSLLGTKIVLNEFLAYLDLASLKPGTLDAHSTLIMTYALCSFANFGSLGIMIGGLGTLAPTRRDEIVGFGLRAILAGTLATCMTGAAIGIVSS
ncbi:MAG TPA: nucleoside transporter C-terminal domain-containing protein [Alphaproteobacteria bacterium]|nr:nucleoside transporter C-terminal domain-containing protein [Alphaproteobacteria bacterium]